MTEVLIELISAVAIFISLVFFSLVPYCGLSIGARSKSGATVLSLCNCVACGIFLSTCFLGLIPHVRMQEVDLRKEMARNSTDGVLSGTADFFLNTELIVLIGFVLILLVEQVIFLCGGHSHSHDSPAHGHSHHHVGGDSHRLLPLGDNEPLVGVNTSLIDEDDDDMEEIIFRKENSTDPDHAHHGGHSHAIPLANGLSIRTMFLLLGLSIHSVFEGLALGLQRDKGDFAKILVAIMLHEVLCCLAYGVSLAQQRAPRSAAVTSVCVLSGCIPAGMLTALVVDSFDGSSSFLIRFVLEGIAAGTFVYVACVEMLAAELAQVSGRLGVASAFSVSVGVAIFAFIQRAAHRPHN